MDKYFMWIHYERLHNHNKAKHNKTVCIFLGYTVWPLAYNEVNHQFWSPNFAGNWPILPLKVHIPITFPADDYCLICIAIAKIFLDLAEGTMALIFMAGCSYWLCKAKNNQSSLWSDRTRRDKPLSKHPKEHHCWSTRVIYTGCRDVVRNS